jgi:hypothetical protein
MAHLSSHGIPSPKPIANLASFWMNWWQACNDRDRLEAAAWIRA